MAESNDERVRCAVIGAGWWGTTNHVPVLLEHPHAKLVADIL